jgi:hypothetical protein
MKKNFLMAVAAVVLAMPSMAQDDDWRWSQDRIANHISYVTVPAVEDARAARTPQTFAEAVAAFPQVPRAEDLVSPEAKEKALRATYKPYELALQNAMERAMREEGSLQKRLDAVRNKQAQRGQQAMAQYQSNVNAGLMPSQQEMMAMYMSGEINEKMSEEKMMDVMAGKFAAKWGISKQEYLKIIGMAQRNPKGTEAYIKSNHPDLYKRLYAANAGYDTQEVPDDPRDQRLGEIGEELVNLQTQLNEAINMYRYDDPVAPKSIGLKADKLFDDARADWKNCSEAKQVDAIEDALQKRIDSWIATLKGNNGEVPYPAWFGVERKKENALIDQWNKRWAQKWAKVAQDGDAKIRPLLEKMAALEKENEQLGQQGDTENAIYLTNKISFSKLWAYLLLAGQPTNDAFLFPCLEHVETEGAAILGKG